MKRRLIVGLGVLPLVAALTMGPLWGHPVTALFAGLAAGAVAAALGAVAVKLLDSDTDVLVRWLRDPRTDRIPEVRASTMQRLFRELSLHTSELIRGRTALERDVRALATIFDGFSEGVWLTDAHGAVTRHNAAFERLVRGRRLVGEPPLAILRSLALDEAVRAACVLGRSSEVDVLLDGPPQRILAVHVFPLPGEPGGSGAVFRDVSELRRLEQVRRDLVANVSHELRTPVTAIRGYAETLQAGALADPAAAGSMVETIHRQAIRLTELLDDLLQLSRLESGAVQLERAPLDAGVCATRALDAVRPGAAAKGIRLVVDLVRPLPAVGDERALEQLVTNLLDNAVKYTPAGGEVALSGEVAGGRCVLAVRDTGPGIDPAQLPRVFERFYRVDRGRARDAGGTGLGLAIVKHLAAGMGAEVRAESQVGAGSTFRVLLAMP